MKVPDTLLTAVQYVKYRRRCHRLHRATGRKVRAA